jgi:hypothetical protein
MNKIKEKVNFVKKKLRKRTLVIKGEVTRGHVGIQELMFLNLYLLSAVSSDATALWRQVSDRPRYSCT